MKAIVKIFILLSFVAITETVLACQLDIVERNAQLTKIERLQIEKVTDFQKKFLVDIFTCAKDKKLKVRIHENKAEYIKAVKKEEGDLGDDDALFDVEGGSYIPSTETIHVIYDEDIVSAIQHEFQHALMDQYFFDFDDLPIWLDEGLADYFDYMRVENDFLIAEAFKERIDFVREWLSSSGPTLKALLTMSPDAWQDWDLDSDGDAYRASWAVIYFLMRNEEGRMLVRKFLHASNEGKGSLYVVNKYYPGGFRSFEKDLIKYYSVNIQAHKYL